jgi:hypothetical protein
MCVSVDRDGDQVFSFAGSGRGGVTKLVGGTGKYAGLTGTAESTRTSLRATMPGTSHSIVKTTYTYKLP